MAKRRAEGTRQKTEFRKKRGVAGDDADGKDFRGSDRCNHGGTEGTEKKMANPAQCGHNSCFRRIAAMLRRVFAIIAVLSAMGFVAFVGLGIRQHFAIDQFHIYRWNPSTRRYTQIFIGWDRDNFGVHTESTTALASDDTSVIRSKAGPS